jgi:hypothetical protein
LPVTSQQLTLPPPPTSSSRRCAIFAQIQAAIDTCSLAVRFHAGRELYVKSESISCITTVRTAVRGAATRTFSYKPSSYKPSSYKPSAENF